MRTILGAMIASLLLAGIAMADPPTAYEGCLNCHGTPGEWWAKTVGPPLTKSTYTYEQFYNQVTYGSNWEGKPKKGFAYRTRVMPAQLGLDDETIQALYDWLVSQRE